MLAATALASAFSGVVTDPIQKALGIHHRRLIALLDTLEDGFLGGDARLEVREHYAARLVDIFGAVASVWSYVKAGAMYRLTLLSADVSEQKSGI